MTRIEERSRFDESTRIGLLEADLDRHDLELRNLSRLLSVLMVVIATSAVLLAVMVVIQERSAVGP